MTSAERSIRETHGLVVLHGDKTCRICGRTGTSTLEVFDRPDTFICEDAKSCDAAKESRHERP